MPRSRDILRRATRGPAGRREETAIGAFARRQRLRRIAVGAAGILLVVVAAVIYRGLRPDGAPAAGQSYPARLRCVTCGYEAERSIRVNESLPLSCPQCGERALHELWRCRSCANVFVPAAARRPVRCPACGSERVGSAAVNGE